MQTLFMRYEELGLKHLATLCGFEKQSNGIILNLLPVQK